MNGVSHAASRDENGSIEHAFEETRREGIFLPIIFDLLL